MLVMGKTKIYLSSGFFTEESLKEVKHIAETIRNSELADIYVPMEYLVPNGEFMPQKEWAQKVFLKDKEELDRCDAVYYLDFGASGDCGAAWEVGYAYANGIPITVFVFGDNISLMIERCANRVIKMRKQEELKLV